MLFTFMLTIFASLLAIVYLWFKKNFSYWRRYPQIPSVKGRIFSGNLMDFILFRTNFGFHLKTIYEDKKFANEAVVGLYGLYKPALLIREPEIIKSVLIKEFDLFRNRSCQGGSHDPLGSLNIFFARYPYWKDIRPKLAPVFSSGKLKNMYPLIQQVGEKLGNILNKQPDCSVHDIIDLSGRYTIDVLSTTILGTTSNTLENPKEFILTVVLKMLEFSYKRALEILIIFFVPKLNPIIRPRIFFKSTEKFMRSSITKIMAERERTGIKRNDLIDAFVKIKQEAEAKGDDVSHCIEGLIAQACILIGAAYDVTEKIVTLTLLELAKNQKVQQRLRQDILHEFLKENGEISYESLSKMEYLQMVIDEVFRLYPALPIFERMHELHTNKSTAFNLKPYYDYELPNEMPVYISPLALHYDAKYWPNPKKFDPERFTPAKKKQMTPMTFMPFGEGPHMCIGSRLGLILIKVAVINYLKNHFVRVCSETITELEIDHKAVILKPKDCVYLEIVRDNLYLNELNKQSEKI